MPTGRRRSGPVREGDERLVIFGYELIWLAVIAWIGWIVATDQDKAVLGFDIPERLKIIPAAVPWYGALGGVLISLVGVHDHRYDWDPRFWAWYVARPVVGAFVAIVAVLIFQSGILAVGLNPSSSGVIGVNGQDVPQDLFYYVLAFVTGYREEAFRSLIKRVADVLFTSKDQAATPVINGVDPAEGPVGQEVTISGTGFKGVQVVRFGELEVDSFRAGSDASIITTIPEGAEPGPVDVTVATADTTVSRPDAFTVT